MVSFLSPLFLIGAAVAAVPLLLHLLKREPQPSVKFSAVRFLTRAPAERRKKRDMRELVLLALRVSALVLFALAFARPFISAGAVGASGGVTIVLLDTSFSMSSPGRFARARTLAHQAIAESPVADLVSVITFDDEAAVVQSPTSDRAAAQQAIDRAQPSFGATRYAAGLAAAVQNIADRNGRIVVVTDLQAGGWKAGERGSATDRMTVAIEDVGALPPNFAVTAVRADESGVVAAIRNDAPSEREARVSLAVDGRPAGQQAVSIAPDGSRDVSFDSVARGSVVTVSVVDPDGLQADNKRYAIAGAGHPSVLLVTSDGDRGRQGLYVAQALAARSSAAAEYQT